MTETLASLFCTVVTQDHPLRGRIPPGYSNESEQQLRRRPKTAAPPRFQQDVSPISSTATKQAKTETTPFPSPFALICRSRQGLFPTLTTYALLSSSTSSSPWLLDSFFSPTNNRCPPSHHIFTACARHILAAPIITPPSSAAVSPTRRRHLSAVDAQQSPQSLEDSIFHSAHSFRTSLASHSHWSLSLHRSHPLHPILQPLEDVNTHSST